MNKAEELMYRMKPGGAITVKKTNPEGGQMKNGKGGTQPCSWKRVRKKSRWRQGRLKLRMRPRREQGGMNERRRRGTSLSKENSLWRSSRLRNHRRNIATGETSQAITS